MRQHISNASWGGFSAAFRAAYGLLNVLLVVRLLGAEVYGAVAALLALFTFYCSLTTSIFTMLVVKLMAQPDERSEFLGAGKAWVACSLALLMLLALVFGAMAGGADAVLPLAWRPAPDRLGVLLALCLLSATQIAAFFQLAMLESLGRFDVATKTQLLGPLLVLLLLLASLLGHLHMSALGYVAILCTGAAVDLAFAYLVRRRFLRMDEHRLRQGAVWRRLWLLLKSGSLLQATALMNMFLEPLNKTLLNSMLGGAAVTVYDLGMKLIWGIQSLFSAAMRVFLHIASQDHTQLESSYLGVVRLISVPAVLLHVVACLFLVVVGRYWLQLDVRELVLFFAVATLSNLGMIGVAPLYNGLIGTGAVGFIFKVQAILGATNVVTSFCMIPVLGVLGAALGLLLATSYNVMAILRKGKGLTGNDRLTADIVRNMGPHVAWAAILFGAAVYCGINREVTLPLGLAVSLCVVFMFFREPVAAYLFAALKQRVIFKGWRR